ncbi:MAG: M14 family zinc carboxypeptidase [Christensenellales bacterium]
MRKIVLSIILVLLFALVAYKVSGANTSPGAELPNSSDSPNPNASPEPAKAVIANVVIPEGVYGYEELLSDAGSLAAMYPDLIETSVIGQSVEGRDILLVKLGKGDKKLLLAGAHHAREYITSTYLMEMADEYARAYTASGNYGSYDIRKLLDQVTVYIVPMVNPDGVNLVQNGIDAVKNPEAVKAMRMLQKDYDQWKANINGVDLNRQYPCHWDEKKSNTNVPSSEMYKGTAPATEPEVKAIMALCDSNKFLLAASFHAKGEVIYWADSGSEDSIEADDTIAQALSGVSGYGLMPVSEDPSVYGGGFENWFRQEFLRPAFCIELTPSNNSTSPHNDSDFLDLVWGSEQFICISLMEHVSGL